MNSSIFQPSRNAPQTLNVLITLHVLIRNARTLASLARVESMHNVEYKSIVPFAFAIQVLSETPTASAKNVRISQL